MSEGILMADGSPAAAEAEASRPSYKVPAAEKALDILEFMADRPEGVTQTEISVGVGRSIHEIYRIIQLLEKRGYLIRGKSDRYRLSLKLFELAHKHPPVNRLIDAALPAMRALAQGADQSCHLVILDGLGILVVLQIDSPLPMRYSVALGSQFPILETSSGAVLLANLPPAEREKLVERLIAEPDSGAADEDIAARLSGIDAIGYEMRPSLAVEGCINISLPIRDHTGTTVAALTVPYLPQKHARFDRRTVLKQAQAAALEISRALGAPEEVLARSTAARR